MTSDMPEAKTHADKVRYLTLTSLAHFINDGTTFFIPIIMDYISLEKNVSPLWITALLTVFYLTSTLLSTVIGRLADRSGRPGTLISVGISLLSVGLLGFYFAVKDFHGLPNFCLRRFSQLPQVWVVHSIIHSAPQYYSFHSATGGRGSTRCERCNG